VTARPTNTAPVTVSGLSGVVAIGIGGFQSCAVLSSGAVQRLGVNASGELGDGTNAQRSAPTPVSGLSTARSVALGHDPSCAVLSDGSARCWETTTTASSATARP
jgi:alpha-tubulin suppressor-like RCC1 family protein